MESRSGEICIPNISLKERNKRLASGVISFLAGLVAFAVMTIFDLSPWWRVALFPIFVAAAAGFFQYRDKT